VSDRRALAELARTVAEGGDDRSGEVRAADTDIPMARRPAGPARPALPSPLTSFVGRASERAALADAVQQRRLVTAVGPGGVGKTRLALAVAADVAERFDEGVWYVDLVPVTDPAMIAPAVAEALGAGEQPSRTIEDTVTAQLADGRALVVLDNCEHLVDGVVVFVERLLGACPNVVVLATSRARLLVPFEWTFPVGGLSVADGDTDGDAVALFLERAAAVGGPPLDPSDRSRIAAVCRDLDGMALAIELAAARLPTLGLDGLEAGLADQIELLAGGSRLDDRHRSLRAMLDWSCALLDPADQAVLRWVCLFAGPFTPEAAAALLTPGPTGRLTGREVAAALARLADQSLLVVVPGPGGTRYRALETIRQYGAAWLDEAGELEAAHAAHLRWCQDAGAELSEHLGIDQGDWRVAFDAVADDLRAALGWVAQQPDRRPAAYALAMTLGSLTYVRGWVTEAERRYDQATRLTDDQAEVAAALRFGAGAATSRHRGDAGMRLHLAAAAAAERAGRYGDAARDLALAATMLLRAPGMIAELPPHPDAEVTRLLAGAWALARRDVHQVAVDAVLLTAEAFHRDEIDPVSRDLTTRAVALARALDDPVIESAALDQLTAVQLANGETFAAAASARRRIDRLRALPLSPPVGFEITDAYQMATETSLGAGDLQAALRFAEAVQALPVYRQEAHLGTARLLTVEGLIGHWDRVLELAVRFREGWERSGRQVAGNLALGASAVGMVHGLRGDEAQRAEWHDIVMTLRASYPHERHRHVFNPTFDAIVLLHRGQPDAAVGELDQAPEHLREWFTGMWMHWYAAMWAEAAVLAGHPEAAGRLERARFITAHNPVASALVDRAHALDTGDLDRLPAIATALEKAGGVYQAARTLALARGEVRAQGEAALAALGAAPMVRP
jgi:predicted ATPase